MDGFLLTQSQINLDFVTIATVCNKIIGELLQLKAGNVTLREIMNLNRMASEVELQNFFFLLEVFGYLHPVNYFDPTIDSLAV